MSRSGVIAAIALAIAAVTVPARPLSAQSLPKLTAPVNDFARVIDPQSAAELDRRIRVLQSTTGDAVVVATVDTFAPFGSIEEYALEMFEQAGIGAKGKDNGLLVLVAVQERRVRLEVGFELEEFITDGYAGETIRQYILPPFREGRFGEGLVAGTTRVIQRIAAGRGVTLADVPPVESRARGRSSGSQFPVGLVVIIIVIIVMSWLNSGGGTSGRTFGRRGRSGAGTWSGWHGGIGGFGGGGFGGGGGGGFGGFGGGRSGGGGASGGW